jgi:glyoxalase family protein
VRPVTEIAGIHHVTSIGANSDRTLDFYIGTLGLTLVARTVNFDEPSVLHFYCGDRAGSPGSLITFFIHEAAPRGRRGIGQVSAVVFAVPRGSLAGWHRQLTEHGVEVIGHAWAFGDQHLCFADPDGLALALIEEDDVDLPTAQSSGDPSLPAIRRIRSIEIQIEGFEHTSRFLIDRFGFEPIGHDGAVFRFLDGARQQPIAIDLLCTPNHRPGLPGPGVAHHVAWRVADAGSLTRMAAAIARRGFDVTPPLDRLYFQAVYFRAPCGV